MSKRTFDAARRRSSKAYAAAYEKGYDLSTILGKRKTPRKQGDQREAAIVQEIRLALGKMNDVVMWRVNPVALADSGGRVVRAGPVGMADLIGIVGRVVSNNGGCYFGRFFAIEAKTAKGRLSPDQITWGKLVNDKGGYYCVCRTAAEAVAHAEYARCGYAADEPTKRS